MFDTNQLMQLLQQIHQKNGQVDGAPPLPGASAPLQPQNTAQTIPYQQTSMLGIQPAVTQWGQGIGTAASGLASQAGSGLMSFLSSLFV